MSYFYMSFCDTTREEGQQFIGATVVEADSDADAVDRINALGINPGGEIAIVEISALPPEAQSYLNRLVPREEVMGKPYSKISDHEDVSVSSVCQECNSP